MTLIAGFYCDVCDMEILAKADINYLFGIRMLEPPELPNPRPLELNDFDRGFLDGLKIDTNVQ